MNGNGNNIVNQPVNMNNTAPLGAPQGQMAAQPQMIQPMRSQMQYMDPQNGRVLSQPGNG